MTHRPRRAETTFRDTVLAWGESNTRTFPWRETDDPYRVLIGEVLLQRTRGAQVLPVYERFIERWPSPLRLARARVASIASTIRPLGLAKRAPSLKALGRALAEGTSFPLEADELIRLPGVGPYISHAVPVFAAGRDLPLVDWVIARILRRYFGLQEGKVPNADPGLWDVWKENLVGQGTLFGDSERDAVKVSLADRERCEVLFEFDNLCKKSKLGVSLRTNGGLETYPPGHGVNFWFYRPQHTADIAPVIGTPVQEANQRSRWQHRGSSRAAEPTGKDRTQRTI